MNQIKELIEKEKNLREQKMLHAKNVMDLYITRVEFKEKKQVYLNYKSELYKFYKEYLEFIKLVGAV